MFNKKLLAFLVLTAIALIGCDFNGGSIANTTWTNQVFGIGSGVKFNADNTGMTFTMSGNVRKNTVMFSYSYDSGSQSGTAIYTANGSYSNFTISGNKLSLDGNEYTYDTINNR